ncbi:MAG: response regulator transcription factor [Bacteroidia bacterium]
MKTIVKEPQTEKKTTKVMIVDDHKIVIESLANLINSKEGYQVVQLAENGRAAISYLEKISPADYPDVILMDLLMEEDDDQREPDGLRTSRYIFKHLVKKGIFETRVIILSSALNGLYISAAHDMCIQGYLVKESGIKEIIQAIDVVMKGEMYYRDNVYAEMSKYKQESQWAENEIIPPSALELDVLKLTAKGLTAKEISAATADNLKLTVDATEAHKRQLLRKLGAKNVAELIAIAFRLGYLKVY